MRALLACLSAKYGNLFGFIPLLFSSIIFKLPYTSFNPVFIQPCQTTLCSFQVTDHIFVMGYDMAPIGVPPGNGWKQGGWSIRQYKSKWRNIWIRDVFLLFSSDPSTVGVGFPTKPHLKSSLKKFKSHLMNACNVSNPA